MPTRQTLDRIEQRPKVVHSSDTWSDPANLMKNPNVARKIAHIVRSIQNGTPLPSGYYRKGLGLDRDALLEAHGIMHLHLGRSNSPELLYLVQYPDDVVLLELSDHAHFATRPSGKYLVTNHAKAVAAKEAEIEAAPLKPKPAMKVRRGPIPKPPSAPKRDPTGLG